MSGEHIRNFSIIAHIDHGKSTLADRLLEATQTIPQRQMKEQVMDRMELERERGITIKSKAIRMVYQASKFQMPNDKLQTAEEYILNLIDTPGHVDFTYEVSRALAACEGALLVVDASQGVEAQTLANANLAKEAELMIIPVINKIDLSQADPENTQKQIEEILDIRTPPILASAKDGVGTEEILQAILRQIPAPKGNDQAPLSALVFDSLYDPFRGVILFIKIVDGVLRTGAKVKLFSSGFSFTAEEVGHLTTELKPQQQLSTGEVGYLVGGIKDVHQIRIGDTLTEELRPTEKPLPGCKEVKPVVFAGFYPINPADYDQLRKALEKLHLTDSAFFYQPESSAALGTGFRLGFLGLLHMEIIRERLQREFNQELVVTTPQVVYQVKTQTERIEVDNPAKWPDPGAILEVQEPYVLATIVTPTETMSKIADFCKTRRGIYQDIRTLGPTRNLMVYELPLAEIILDFYDSLKSISKGYASFDYEPIGYRPGELVKLEILLHNELVDALSLIIHKDKAYTQGRALAEKLKELIPRQLFEVAIQARVGSRVIARETIPALRRDVLSKCYGGDVTRKRKLLEKQKEGKKKLKQLGKVEVPQEAFLAVLKIGK